jgi:hypothetical protein
MGLLDPVNAVDSITLIALPFAVLLLLLLLECKLHPENTRHVAAAAATGATSLRFMDVLRWGPTATVTCITSHHLDGKLSVIQHLSIVGCLVCFQQDAESQAVNNMTRSAVRTGGAHYSTGQVFLVDGGRCAQRGPSLSSSATMSRRR